MIMIKVIKWKYDIDGWEFDVKNNLIDRDLDKNEIEKVFNEDQKLISSFEEYMRIFIYGK